MATQIFLGEPPANIKQWIIEHATPATHADTWYKYEGDTEWRTISISGTLNGNANEETPTTQIPDVTNIVALEIGTDVTSIQDYAFLYCSSLTNVTIPNSVTNIGGYTFRECNELTSVTIPNSVTNIGEYAFHNCYSLTSMTIPNSVMRIDAYAFFWCTGFTSVTIPDSITSIGERAFSQCESLTSVMIVATGKLGANAENVKQMIITAIDDTSISDNIKWN